MTISVSRRAVVGLAMVILSHCLYAQQSSSPPADPKLAAAYQHIHFDRQYPADAVVYIEGKLQKAPRAVDVLPELAKDERADVRVLVATLLGELGESDGAKALWLLTRDNTDYVRTAAAGAIVRLSRLTPVVASMEGLKDSRADVRRLTLALLGQVADTSAEGAILQVVSDPDSGVRAEAIGALGTCGTGASIPSITEGLRDQSALVRTAAASSLGRFDN